MKEYVIINLSPSPSSDYHVFLSQDISVATALCVLQATDTVETRGAFYEKESSLCF